MSRRRAKEAGGGGRSSPGGPPRRPESGESGSGLLVVIGATAALAVMAQLLLLSATIFWATLSFQLDRRQAAELARAGLLQVAAGLRAGTLAPPDDGPAEVTAALAALPSPPPSPAAARVAWPPATPDPPAPDASLLGMGREVVLDRVRDPYGVPRTGRVPGSPDAGAAALVEARSRAWFRRAVVERTARFLVDDDGGVRWLE